MFSAAFQAQIRRLLVTARFHFGTMHHHYVLRPEALGVSHVFWFVGVCDAFLFAASAHPTLDQKHRKLKFFWKNRQINALMRIVPMP